MILTTRPRVELGIQAGSGLFRTVLRADDPSLWINFESELLDGGVPIPLTHRSAWVQAHPHRRHWHVSVRDSQGTAEAVAVVAVGAEYMLEPNPALASMSRFVSSAGSWLKNRLGGPTGVSY